MPLEKRSPSRKWPLSLASPPPLSIGYAIAVRFLPSELEKIMLCSYCHCQDCRLCQHFLVYLRFRLADLAENELVAWWRKNGTDPITVSDAEAIFREPREELTVREATKIWLPGIHHHLCINTHKDKVPVVIGQGYRAGHNYLRQPYWETLCDEKEDHATGLCADCQEHQ